MSEFESPVYQPIQHPGVLPTEIRTHDDYELLYRQSVEDPTNFWDGK